MRANKEKESKGNKGSGSCESEGILQEGKNVK